MRHIQGKTIILLATFFLAGLFGTAAIAADYIGLGQFTTPNLTWGLGGSEFDGSGGSYWSPARIAVSSWSSNSDVNFTEIASCPVDVQVKFDNYGSAYGLGYACVNGTCSASQIRNISVYTFCEARINTYHMASMSQANRLSVVLHEVGHCLSLDHRTDATSIMQAAPPMSIIAPNVQDTNLVNARY